MYDATYMQIFALQVELQQHGISKEMLDLDNYAGLTYIELKSIVDDAIKLKEKKTNVDCD